MQKSATLVWFFVVLIGLFPWVFHYQQGWTNVVINDLDHKSILAYDFSYHYLPQAALLKSGTAGFAQGWFYPPLLAILLIPFLSLSNPVFWWTLGNLLCLLGMVWLCAKAISSQVNLKTWLLALMLVSSSLPVIHCLKWGQVSLLINVVMILALQNSNRKTGFLIGFCSAIKIYPAFVGLYGLARQRVSLLLGLGSGFAVFGLGLPIFIIGSDEAIQYFQHIWANLSLIGDISPKFGGQSIRPTMYRWFVSGESLNRIVVAPEVSNIVFYPWDAWVLSVETNIYEILVNVFVGLLTIGMCFSLFRSKSNDSVKIVVFLCWLVLALGPGWHHYFSPV